MEQSAVEWLVDNLNYYYSPKWNDIFEQAKEMEKQQIIDACNQEECFGSSGYGIHEDITKGEEYYNVTFKNK
jgi:hypothetical protein